MKKFWKSDHFLRIASVFAAILLWIFVVYQENPIHEIWINSVPVSFINRSASFENGKLVITDGENAKVNLKIQGRRSAISTAKASNVSCTVNLADIEKEGSYTLPVSVNISAYGVELVSKDPYNVTIEVDKVVTQERTVDINKSGSPKNGFVEGTVDFTPSSVKLTGPESIVRNIASASVVLDLTDAAEDIAGLYKIRLYDAEGKEITDTRITKNIEYCDVRCPILATKEVTVSPTLTSETNSLGHKISVVAVSPGKITLVGRKEQLDRIDTVLTESIQTSDIDGMVTVNAELVLDGISEGVLISNDVKTVKVELNSEAEGSVNPDVNPTEETNNTENENAEESKNNIEITQKTANKKEDV